MMSTRPLSGGGTIGACFARLTSAPFDAQYAAYPGEPMAPRTDPSRIAEPPPDRVMGGIACLRHRNGPFTFTSSTRRHSSSLLSPRDEGTPTPALHTSTHSPPPPF